MLHRAFPGIPLLVKIANPILAPNTAPEAMVHFKDRSNCLSSASLERGPELSSDREGMIAAVRKHTISQGN
jgi:hypothetical protein